MTTDPESRFPTGGRLVAVALGLATIIGFISTALQKLARIPVDATLTWAQAATGWIDWYIWALLTPLVVWLARALPVQAERWPRAIAGHLLLGTFVCAGELALFALVMIGYNELFMHQTLLPYGDRYVMLLGRWLPLQMLIYALIVAVVSAVDHGRRARERDVAAARLETELARAQMHGLQAQIQPHFLFNTLNTVSMAVREGRKDAAVEMMAHLSGILRRTVEAAVRPEATLSRELGFVRHYLRLERYRMEERLTVRWNVDDDVLDARVPTMLLQPLVENAVRHGLAELDQGGAITVHGAARDGSLVLQVEDDGVGIAPDADEGTGIGNVRRRLQAQYGSDASLTMISPDGGGTIARIILPLKTHEPSRIRAAGPRAHR